MTLSRRPTLTSELLSEGAEAAGLAMSSNSINGVESMRAGKAITVAPLDQRLTTQEAADFLGISRPTLVKLLEQGEIPYERPAAGRHRRVRLSDVLDYQIRKRQERRTTLDQMTADAAEAGLYDEVPDYSEALRRVRKRRAS